MAETADDYALMREEVAAECNNFVKLGIDSILEVWQECYDAETITGNLRKMPSYVKEILDDIEEEALATRSKLGTKVEELLKELEALCVLTSEEMPNKEYENLVLNDAIEALNKQIQHYSALVEVRTTEIQELLKSEEDLCNTLGYEVKSLPMSPLPAAVEINAFRQYLICLREEVAANKSAVDKLQHDIIDLFEELGAKPMLEFERIVIYRKHIKPANSNIIRLKSLHEKLVKDVEHSKETATDLREKLSHLWERLDESHTHRSNFLMAHPGYTEAVITTLRNEIARCEEKKRANIQIFLTKAREELTAWWNRCLISDAERSQFLPFYSDCYSEDLLMLHELQIEKQQFYYDCNKSIFELFQKRTNYWNKMRELEARANDPSRYNNRGGMLLKEEKERKQISAKIPKLEEDLRQLIEKYEQEHGEKFMVYGEPLEVLIEKSHEDYKEERHRKLSARKEARAKTPLSATNVRHLTGVTHTTTLKRKVSPAPATPSAKRKLVLTTQPIENPSTVKKEATNHKLQIPNANKENGATKKPVTLKTNIIKRIRSLRRSNSGRKSHVTGNVSKHPKRRSFKSPVNSTLQYADFEGHLSARKSLRSSVYPPQGRIKSKPLPKIVITTSTEPMVPSKSNLLPLQESAIPRTPAGKQMLTRQNTATAIGRTIRGDTPAKPLIRSGSTVQSPQTNRTALSTKNLPVYF